MLESILIESVLLPTALAALLALAGRALPAGSARFASGAAIAIALLAAHVAMRGWPALWPQSASETLPALALLGLAGGIWAEHLRPGRAWRRHLSALVLALAVLWTGHRGLAAAFPEILVVVLGLAVAAILGFHALGQAAARPGRLGTIMLMLGLGIGGVAFFGRSASLAQIGLVLGTSGLAVALAAGPGRLGAAALLAWGAPVTGLATTAVLFSGAEAALLALSACCLAADPLGRARLLRRIASERTRFLVLVLIPPLAAIGLAFARAGLPSGL